MPFTIDGSTGFLIPDGADISLTDDDKLQLGTGNDLQIYHDGTTNNSYIKESGTGHLIVQGQEIQFDNASGTSLMNLSATQIEMLHNGTKVLETTSNGIDVTGVGTNFKSATYNILNLQTDTNNDGTSDDGIFKITNGSAGTTKAEFRWDESEDTVQIAYGDHGRSIVIDSNDRVGINYSSPATTGAQLTVQGPAGSNAIAVLGNGTSGNSWGLGVNAGSTSADASFRVYDKDGSNSYFYVRGDGNVGISVDDPTDKLTLTVGNGGGILQSTYYSGTATSGQKMGVIGFKGYSQGNTVTGADAKIEGVADGAHSGTSAPGRLDFYVKHPSVGPGSSAQRRMQITSYGELNLQKGATNWASFYMNEDSGIRYHAKRFYTGASSATQNVMRVKRHYWGSGFYKISVKQQYYSSVTEQNFYLTGHGRNDGSYSPSYSLVFSDVYNGASGRLSITAPQSGAPGNSAANYVDVQISIPAYTHWVLVVEAGGQPAYSQDVTVMGGNDMYALHN